MELSKLKSRITSGSCGTAFRFASLAPHPKRYAQGTSMKLLATFFLFIFATNAYSLEISDFKSGLMCGINKDEMGWVCFEQENILITGQSSCSSQGVARKCTWYGYSFNYRNAKKDQIIKCKYSYSRPTDLINYESELDQDTTYSEFEFKLKKPDGYFINPQYSTLAIAKPGEGINVQNVVCSSEGNKLYEYTFKTISPAE